MKGSIAPVKLTAMLPARTANAISETVQRFTEVDAAFLFGSYATGTATSGSDIDLALAPASADIELPKLLILAELTKAGIDNIDLIDLNQSDPIVRFEAVSPNKMLYARPEFDRGTYYSRVIREYFDLLPLLRVQRAALKKRMSDGYPEVLRKRPQKLSEYLRILESNRKYSFTDYSTDPERYGSTERFLQLAIEAVNDMGNHVIADNELGIVNRSADIPNLLKEEGNIDADLRDQWIKMIGFRNILVHDYLEIDLKIVYEVLQNHLSTLQRIQRSLARYL